MKRISFFIFAIMLLGCASSQWGDGSGSLCDSQMTKLGPDTYMSSAIYGNGCGTDYKVRHAGIFCSRMGKQIVVTNIDNSLGGNVIFRCLSPGDPELQRPTYRREADIVIEQRE